MSSTPNRSSQRRALLGVEQLESRQLLTVAVTPILVNLKSVNHGNGVLTVRVFSDTQATKDLLSTGGQVEVSVVGQDGVSHSLGTALRTKTQDVTGDGVADLQLKFRRSALKGLAAGTYTVQVAAASTTPTTTPTSTTTTSTTPGDTGTLILFAPGGHHGHGHHGHGHHGHGGDA